MATAQVHNSTTRGELVLKAAFSASGLALFIEGRDFPRKLTPRRALQAFPFIFQPVTGLLLSNVSGVI